jgi:hypothetical protein
MWTARTMFASSAARGGQTVADRPDYNAVGETVIINQRPFRIVGIFQFYESEEDKRRL